MNENLDNPVSDKTIDSQLHEMGYYSRVALRKPFVSESNRIKRYKWCMDRKSWNLEWQYIVWSDESRFNLYQNDGRQRVWRQPKEKYDIDCLTPTHKHGGGGVMVWGCFVSDTLGSLVIVVGKMTGNSYVNLLKDYLLPFLNRTENPSSLTFQDDNAAIHTARVVLRWKEENSITSLPWPAQSPDLNPIEHLWDYLEKLVRRKGHIQRTLKN